MSGRKERDRMNALGLWLYQRHTVARCHLVLSSLLTGPVQQIELWFVRGSSYILSPATGAYIRRVESTARLNDSLDSFLIQLGAPCYFRVVRKT